MTIMGSGCSIVSMCKVGVVVVGGWKEGDKTRMSWVSLEATRGVASRCAINVNLYDVVIPGGLFEGVVRLVFDFAMCMGWSFKVSRCPGSREGD